MMQLLTDTQKRTVLAIVNLFETGHVLGDYSKVTLLAGDTGHLTYGRSQTTLGSGNLHKLIAAYVGRCGARFGKQLEPYLPALEARHTDLDHDLQLHNLLRASADDGVMRDTQDEFFDRHYWDTAERIAKRDGLHLPLAVAVVYDSVVHGSWTSMRRRTLDNHGSVEGLGAEAWVEAYVAVRHAWLANHSRHDLRRTVYRMVALQRLIEQRQWALELPLVVRGAEISQQSLAAMPPNVYDGPEPRSRVVALSSPLSRGLDIRLAQLALSGRDFEIMADGIFGRVSSGIVKSFQDNAGLPVTGVLDMVDFEALDL